MTRAELQAQWRALAERAVAEYRTALGEDLLAVACFGSEARGEADLESDLDLYVVTATEIASLTDRRLDAVCLRDTPEYRALTRRGFQAGLMPIFHPATKVKTHPWILLDIADHGVILCDPEGMLAREPEAVRCRLRELGSQRIQRPDGSWYWDLKPDWCPGEIIQL